MPEITFSKQMVARHVSVQVNFVLNELDKLSASAVLLDHEYREITRLEFADEQLKSFESFVQSIKTALFKQAGVVEKAE